MNSTVLRFVATQITSSRLRKASLLIVFLAIFALGTALRVRNAGQTLPFFGDTDRDVLVAKHILLDGKLTEAYPAAYGGRGLLKNSPHYFNILSLLHFLGRSPEGMATILAIIASFNIPLAYWAGKVTGGGRLGIALAFLTATNFFLVSASQQIYQPHILVTISSAAVCFLIIGVKKKSLLALSAAGFLFPLGLHVHYSIIPILIPVSIIFFISFLFRKKLGFSLAAALLPMAIMLGMIAFWLFTINKITPLQDGLVRFVELSYSESGKSQFNLTDLSGRADIFLSTLFMNSSSGVLGLSVIILLVLVSTAFSSKELLPERLWSAGIVFLFSSILITVFSKVIFDSYYSPYYFLFLYMVAYAAYKVTSKLPIFVFAIVILLTSQLWLAESFNKYYSPNPTGFASDRESVAHAVKIILDDARASELQPEEIAIIDKSSKFTSLGWMQPAYYYAFEEMTGKKLVEINTEFNDNPYNNIRPIHKAKTFYLTCTEDNFETRSLPEVLKECIDSFWYGADDTGFYRDYYQLTVNMEGVKTFDPITVAKLQTVIFRFDTKE